MIKIRQYSSTLEITRGFFTALLASGFIYMNHWGLSYPIVNTILALSSLFLLLQSNTKTWFWHGSFIGIFWFWWISLSLQHYGYAWGLPIGIVLIALGYGIVFWGIAKISSWCCKGTTPYIFSLTIKAIGLLILSYVHPFGFDWLKPELMFVESYLGIEKWQFACILLSIVLSIWRENLLFLLLIFLAYQPTTHHSAQPTNNTIALVSTHTTVEDKWNTSLHAQQFKAIFQTIDKAIAQHKSLIILPESVFPLFLNRSEVLMRTLKEKAKHISIVTGGLYWDGKTPHNSAYIFDNNKVTIANKVILVPFGESNPLPDFLSDWVNRVFYDDAIDYEASADVTDYKIGTTTYRNAICFEATSEKLYEKDKEGKYPKNMIVLSNNGWFTPSTEPTLQKLLLQYYSKKYGTSIYHSINMSESYVIHNGITKILLQDFGS